MPTDLRSTHDDAEHVLAVAAEAAGLQLVPPDEGDRAADLAVDVGGGRSVQIDVRALSHAGPDRVRRAIAKDRSHRTADDRVVVLVADTITAHSRRLLADAGWGWYDRRGHLRIRGPGLVVDTAALPAPGREADDDHPVRGRAGLAVALQLLLEPNRSLAVRATARSAALAPSSISRMVERLRRASLIDADGRPLVPELFWVLAEAWPVAAAIPLKRRPPAGDGWAMSGTRAALAWGASGAVTTAFPAELYVPTERDARRAAQEYGEAARPAAAAALVRVAPTPLVQTQFFERGERWPLVHPVVAALDLAQDLGRGVEMLEGWNPPPPYVRVW